MKRILLVVAACLAASAANGQTRAHMKGSSGAYSAIARASRGTPLPKGPMFVKVQSLDDYLKKRKVTRFHQKYGAVVVDLGYTSPLKWSGIERSDIIFRIARIKTKPIKIKNATEFETWGKTAKEGDKISVKRYVKKFWVTKTITLTLAKPPKPDR